MESASLFPIEHKRRRRLKAKMHRQGVLHYISNSMLNIPKTVLYFHEQMK